VGSRLSEGLGRTPDAEGVAHRALLVPRRWVTAMAKDFLAAADPVANRKVWLLAARRRTG